jgi:hypothetical protein
MYVSCLTNPPLFLIAVPTFSLARLPKSFVELYSIVNKVKGRDESTLVDDSDDVGSAETAICLLSGAVMRSGSSRRSFSRSVSLLTSRDFLLSVHSIYKG